MTNPDAGIPDSEKSIRLPVRHLATAMFMLLGALGVWTCLQAVSYGVGSPVEPAAGTWPMFVGVALCVLSLWLLIVRDSQSERGEVEVLGAFGVWLIAAVWALLLNYLTFIAVASVCLFVLFRFLGRASWLTAVVVPVSLSTAVYLLFTQLLAVSLP